MDGELQGLKPLDETGQAEVLPDQTPPAEPIDDAQPAPEPAMLDRRHASQPTGEA